MLYFLWNYFSYNETTKPICKRGTQIHSGDVDLFHTWAIPSFSFSCLHACFLFRLWDDPGQLTSCRTGRAVSAWSSGGFENQEPAQFEERHLIFLQQLGKVWRRVGRKSCAPMRSQLHHCGRAENESLLFEVFNKTSNNNNKSILNVHDILKKDWNKKQQYLGGFWGKYGLN